MSFGLAAALIVFVLIFILRMPIALGMLSAAVCYLLITGRDLSLVVNQVMNTFYTNCLPIRSNFVPRLRKAAYYVLRYAQRKMRF